MKLAIYMSVYFVSLLVTARQFNHDSGCGVHMARTFFRVLGHHTQLNIP